MSQRKRASRAGRILISLVTVALIAVGCSGTPTVTITEDGLALAELDPGEAAVATPESLAAATPGAIDSASGVGQPSVAFEATPTFLAFASEETASFETFRIDMFQQLDAGRLMTVGSREIPFATLESAGDRLRLTMDMGSLGDEAWGGSSLPSDSTMEMIVDSDFMYWGGGFFADLARIDPTGSAEVPVVATLAQGGWGRVDLSRLVGETSQDTMAAFGASAADAEALFALLRDASDVLPGGASEVQGVPTEVIYATVAFQDLVGAVGLTPADAGLPPAAFDGNALPVSVEVHVDSQNRLRRLAYHLNLDALLSQDLEALTGIEDHELTIWHQLDLYDFDVPIEIVPPAESVDITDDLLAFVESSY